MKAIGFPRKFRRGSRSINFEDKWDWFRKKKNLVVLTCLDCMAPAARAEAMQRIFQYLLGKRPRIPKGNFDELGKIGSLPYYYTRCFVPGFRACHTCMVLLLTVPKFYHAIYVSFPGLPGMPLCGKCARSMKRKNRMTLGTLFNHQDAIDLSNVDGILSE